MHLLSGRDRRATTTASKPVVNNSTARVPFLLREDDCTSRPRIRGAQYRSQPDCGFAGRTVRRRGYRPGNNAWWLYWYWRQGFHPCVLDRIAGSNPVHVTQQLKSSSPVGVRSTLISGSSAAERPPVKRMVPGSNPGRRARSKGRYSCIAQMVRASGCYPESPRFESWCGSWGECRKLHGTPKNRTCGCGLPTSGRLAER